MRHGAPAHPGSLLWLARGARAARARHAHLRHVLAGHDVRPRAAAHPGRASRRGASRAGRARPRRPALARQRLPLPAVPQDAARAASWPSSHGALQRRHPGALPPAALPRRARARRTSAYEDVNPLCGDRVRIEGRLADGRLAEARWTRRLLRDLRGLRRPAARGGARPAGGASRRPRRRASLLERLEADIRPSRMKCVTLPADRAAGALSGQEVTR